MVSLRRRGNERVDEGTARGEEEEVGRHEQVRDRTRRVGAEVPWAYAAGVEQGGGSGWRRHWFDLAADLQFDACWPRRSVIAASIVVSPAFF